ncbi:MAG: alpha/beta fold hydrolase [Oscillospiraceae bacterium]|jgi:alpha-beta hydrolase superfamily lysophospholipase|nr:alpha/beta fold hydrolase [Oscillospiraceae bacterium]
MKKLLRFMLLFAMLMPAGACAGGDEAASPTPLAEPLDKRGETERLAGEFVQNLAAGKSEAAWELCDKTVQNAISAAALQRAWVDSVTAQLGAFVEVTDYKISESDGYTICETYSAHENSENFAVSRVVFDSDGKIAGIFFSISGNEPLADEPIPDAITEETVTIGDKYPLEGRLTLPKNISGAVAAVVMLSGSGPNDMDETIYRNKPFRDIAHYLSEAGYAVLRFNKRTYSYAAELVRDVGDSLTVNEEYIEDALYAKKFLENDERINSEKIYLLGHSLGGALAPRIAAEGDFSGIIIMAGTLRSMPEIALEQYEYLAALPSASPELKTAADSMREDYENYLKTVKLPDEEAKAAKILGSSIYYFKEMEAHPAIDYLKTSDKPTLILQGGADYQVSAAIDFEQYKAIKKVNIKCVLYKNLNHLFMPSEAEKSTPNEYLVKAKVSTAPLKDIAGFLRDNG